MQVKSWRQLPDGYIRTAVRPNRSSSTTTCLCSVRRRIHCRFRAFLAATHSATGAKCSGSDAAVPQGFLATGAGLADSNLSGGQTDVAALHKDGPQSSSAQSSNPIAQRIQQLSTDLQSGNLTAAQRDYTNLQQDFQNQASPMQRPHHHHRNHSGGGQNTAISQVLCSWDRTCGRATWVGAEGLQHVATGSAAVRDCKRGARWDGFDDGERQRVRGESSSIRAGFPVWWERLQTTTAKDAKQSCHHDQVAPQGPFGGGGRRAPFAGRRKSAGRCGRRGRSRFRTRCGRGRSFR